VDTGNNSIRVIDTAGMVSTLFASTDADITQRLNAPTDMAIDTSGNLYIADTGNHVIRKITATGSLTTLAGVFSSTGTVDGSGTLAEFNTPVGIALNEDKGELYIADSGNHAIRTLALASGSVVTLAGTPGKLGSENGASSAARFNAPGGLIVDSAGDIYIADTGNSLIRKITPTGEVTTIAGYTGIDEIPGVPGFKDGQGTAAWFDHPGSLALSPNGTLFIADSGNLAIRTIDSSDNVATLTVTSTATSTTAPPPVTPGDNSSSGSGGGGGASSLWLLALLGVIASIRRLYKK
jgi:sugar lactone lactonase YvrE